MSCGRFGPLQSSSVMTNEGGGAVGGRGALQRGATCDGASCVEAHPTGEPCEASCGGQLRVWSDYLPIAFGGGGACSAGSVG